MTIRYLDKMFKPASMVLIGPGPMPGTVGNVVLQNVLGSGFEGKIFRVDPGPETPASPATDIPTYARISELPEVPDLAVILRPPAAVPGILRELGEKGTRAAVVMMPGLFEKHPWTRERLGREMLAAAKPYGLRIIGPGSLGIMSPLAFLNAGYAHIHALSGWLAFVGQSDNMIASVLDWATHHRIGFSHFVSLGDSADVDVGDMLDYLANDHHTRAVLLYVETVADARKFMSAARAASRMKPVIVFKAGRAGPIVPDGVSHVESDAVYDAAFRRAGMLRVSSIQALFDAAATLAALQSVTGSRLGILTNSSGAGALAADSLIAGNGRLAEFTSKTAARLRRMLPATSPPANPLNLGEDADPDRYAAALEILLEDRHTDAVLVLNCPHAIVSGTAVARAVIEVFRSKLDPYGKRHTLLTNWIGRGAAVGHGRLFAENAIPTYETPDDAIRAFMRMVRYRHNQEMLMETPPSIPDAFSPVGDTPRKIIGTALARGRDRLTKAEASALLEAYRIPTAKMGGLADAERAEVEVNCRSNAHELMIGMTEDARFGPVIRFGHGGNAVDIIDDQALALPPLNLHLAREVMERTRIFKLLKGYGDTPAADLDAVALVLVKVSQLICDIAEIRELVINPILADPDGVTVMDAAFRISPSESPPEARLAIRPYPRELEAAVRTKDGRGLLVRPIRPEDEPAFCDLFDSMSREEVRLRFFRYMKTISHTLAARLTQIDYNRQMALVLTDMPEPGATASIYGAVHVNMDPDNVSAEFAVMVRSDMTGMGLGSLLMRQVMQYCRRRGVSEIFGDVLADNTAMLALARSLGFQVERRPEDPAAVVVRLRLDDA
ncbi:bifunctional acetate--CoA ligase family protein/GNAT family N-acetyltransferase [Desulfococcus multivorans]|uniref:CoA-binding domain protein n=1 Tax=Desulfococcus multivorans DSM 2059 TaxID=1121405 RepID=S7UUM5_DESML|nr:GNAT family N-acetyltransferase [Desulfococcus multivorans]AOY58704.1 acetyltransferase, GNAT family [Desulfococcus multivorans]AQV00990.1 GNAT family N-acetyltransferase [Desulfococcus multivorans]EPR37744.1 CoA-binding domain protein [Desulfococcus multivorans DSM 2059]SJZ46629.1 acetyltransferase [Desulfococcus multivorans DSM 2059]